MMFIEEQFTIGASCDPLKRFGVPLLNFMLTQLLPNAILDIIFTLTMFTSFSQG